MKPTLGRIVLYRFSETTVRPAIVSGVYESEPDRADLHVFTQEGDDHRVNILDAFTRSYVVPVTFYGYVRHAPDLTSPNTWDWPPRSP